MRKRIRQSALDCLRSEDPLACAVQCPEMADLGPEELYEDTGEKLEHGCPANLSIEGNPHSPNSRSTSPHFPILATDQTLPDFSQEEVPLSSSNKTAAAAPLTVEKFLQALNRVCPQRPKTYGRQKRRIQEDDRPPLRFSKVPLDRSATESPQRRRRFADKSPEPQAITRSDPVLPSIACLDNECDAESSDEETAASDHCLFDEKPVKKKRKVVRAWTTVNLKHGVPLKTPSFNTWKAMGDLPKRPRRRPTRNLRDHNRETTDRPPQLSFIPLAQAEKTYQQKSMIKQSRK